MKRTVLNYGQCGFDHGNLSRVLSGFGVEAVKVDLAAELESLAASSSPALILVNRVADHDGASGIELIRRLKANPRTRDIPLMLVSNYADAQEEAVKLGALPGFGKSSLDSSATEEKLKSLLSSS